MTKWYARFDRTAMAGDLAAKEKPPLSLPNSLEFHGFEARDQKQAAKKAIAMFKSFCTVVRASYEFEFYAGYVLADLEVA